MKRADTVDGPSTGWLSGIPGLEPACGSSSVHMTLSSLACMFPCLSSETLGLKEAKARFNLKTPRYYLLCVCSGK